MATQNSKDSKEVKIEASTSVTDIIKSVPDDELQSPVEITKNEKVGSGRQAKVDRDAYVTIMNTTNGTVIYKSKKTGQEWKFTEYGQTDDIQVSELINMHNIHKRYLREPWLIIVDENDENAKAVIAYLGLNTVYENLIKPADLERFFRLEPDKMEIILNRVPDGIKQLIVSKTLDMVRANKFDSISRIKVIQKVANVDFEELI